MATALAAAAAAGLVGALLGLLFGVPRSLSQTTLPAQPPAGGGTSDTAQPQSAAQMSEGYGGNSNLEQISDWLTKIIVGATLVQAGTLYDRFRGLARSLGNGLCGCDTASCGAATAFAGGLLASFGAWGFFLGYLLTRRVLPALLRRGEEEGHGLTEQDKSAIKPAVEDATSSARSGKTRQSVLDEHPESEAAAMRLAAIPLENVEAKDLPAWASAQMLLGDYQQAVRGFEATLALHLDTPDVIEHLMFSALYLPPPTGFGKTIGAGKAAAAHTPAMDAYLACAYGQKHRWGKGRGEDPLALKLLRDEAYAAAKRALDADPSWGAVFKSLMDPGGSADDDLESFRDDPEFRTLVGLE